MLICTSGSAGANYYPAVIEARMSHTPLVVLTADRPPELRGTGAPQTIDQRNLFGRHVLHFRDLITPEADGDFESWRDAGVEAFDASLRDPGGPVHLNVPFREPLLPAPDQLNRLTEVADDLSPPRTDRNPEYSWDHDWKATVEEFSGAGRGLIVCGPVNTDDAFRVAVTELARRTGFPVLADPASGVRFASTPGVGLVSHYDLILANPHASERLRPEAVLRFGGLPTSKRLNEWLAALPPHPHLVFDLQSEIADPYGIASRKVSGPLTGVCERLCHQKAVTPPDSTYAEQWMQADHTVQAELDSHFEKSKRVFEGMIAADAIRLAPDRSVVFLASSLPIRLADAYAGSRPGPLRVLANRGANGIDGLLSTACGVATTAETLVVLIIGDVALLHDLNALSFLAHSELNLKVVLLNNDGGGIFSFLPLGAHSEFLEKHVALPHGTDFESAARSFGIRHVHCRSRSAFEQAFTSGCRHRGPEIIEIRTDRETTLTISRDIQRRIALAQLVD